MPMHVLRTLKFVALSDPELGYSKKFGQSLDTPMLEFLQHFECPCNSSKNVGLPAKFEVRRDNSVAKSQTWRKEDVRRVICVGSRPTVRKSVGEFL